MKKVEIIYNPFLLSTLITVDGKQPAKNSSLDFKHHRLQEWAEKLPKILKEEYRDNNFTVEFTGTLDDFIDLKEILKANNDKVSFTDFIHHRKPDVKEVEDDIIKIYDKIENGPVEALKDEAIKKAFEKALGAEFSINVVATMSSGKSSLINALLGKSLMPVANMATTATIVRIIATPQDNFSGIAFDENGKELHRKKDLDLETMTAWNNEKAVSSISIYGPVPCVDTVGMRLVLIDTPGPNNSCDDSHRKRTYDMLKASDKSLVLFVMNANQLNIDDEKEFLDYVCGCMKEGGKQSRDRFIFAVNKLDTFQPKNGDKVEVALNSVKGGLDDRDIKEPNLFPVSALAALEIRTDDDDPVAVDTFRRRCRKGEEFHFETYYGFNHLPVPSRKKLDEQIEKTRGEEDEDSELLIHSGIPSIEEAIRLYVSKYARTLKVKDLVDAFNSRLLELNMEAEVIERIRNSSSEKDRMQKEMSKIQEEIKSGMSAMELKNQIDDIDVTKDVRKDLEELVGGMQNRIDNIIDRYEGATDITVTEAKRIAEKIREEKKDMQSQLSSKISSIFEKTFKRTYERIMEIYRKRLKQLGFTAAGADFYFNPMDFIGQELKDLDTIVKESTEEKDEGYDETREREVDDLTKKKTNWFFQPSTWFTKRYEKKKESYTVHIPVMVDKVNMSKVIDEYFVPMQVDLVDLEVDIPKNLEQQADKLKKNMKEEIEKVDKILNRKIEDLKIKMNKVAATEAEIKKLQEELNFTRGIISEVNKLIKY